MTTPLRIIITGSRDYNDRVIVERSLEIILDECQRRDLKLVVVHGHCPTGADHFAHEWAKEKLAPDQIEPHPADWNSGPAAGPERNRQMARAQAKFCLAFCKRLTRGTASMLDAASDSVIPVFIVQRRPWLEPVLRALVAA